MPQGDSGLWICWHYSLPSRVCKLGVFCHWVCILCWMAVFEQVSRTFPLKVLIYSFVGFPMCLSQFYCSGIDVKGFQVIKIYDHAKGIFSNLQKTQPMLLSPNNTKQGISDQALSQNTRKVISDKLKAHLITCIFETGDEKEVVIQEETTLLFSVSCIWVPSYLSCSWTWQ